METFTVDQLVLRFRPVDGKLYFTVSDLQSLPEWPDSPLLELINGDLYLMPSPTTNHQNIVGEIFYQIKSFLKANPIGQVFTAPYDVVLSDEDTVIPDIVFVNSTNEKIITSKNIEGTPDLIIEVVSSNRKRDFISKRNLYEKFGIKEYLIVDLVDKMYYKYLLSIDNIYKAPLEYNIADHISLATVPSFVLSLN